MKRTRHMKRTDLTLQLLLFLSSFVILFRLSRAEFAGADTKAGFDATSGIFNPNDKLIVDSERNFVSHGSIEFDICNKAGSETDCGKNNALENPSTRLRTQPDYYDVTAGVASRLDVLRNDENYDKLDPRALNITIQPRHGIIISVDTKTGEVTYLPHRPFAGEDSFSYTVCSTELEEDSTEIQELQLRAELAVQEVNVIFERHQQAHNIEQEVGNVHVHDAYKHPLDKQGNERKNRVETFIDDDPTSMEHITSWFSGTSDADVLPEILHPDHPNFNEQLIHLKSVEIFSTWLAQHEFYYMRKSTVSTKALANSTRGEWDIVIVEVSSKGKPVYGEVEADIETAVSRIFATDLGYLDLGVELDSSVLAQWLWHNHRENVEDMIQKAYAGFSVGKRKICSDPVKVTLLVHLWAKDDLIEVMEGSTTDVVILANDHPRASPSTLTIVAQPHSGAQVEVIHKHASKSVIRYSLPMGFFGRDVFEYQVCTDHTRHVCARGHVIAQVKHHAVVARNDYFKLPYSPKQQRICPLVNDLLVDYESIQIITRKSERGALLDLEVDVDGFATGCVLYTAQSTTGGDDHFHYEACAEGRGCAQAKVRVDVASSYFGRDSTEVDYLLLRQRVIPELITAITHTVSELKELKQLSAKYDAHSEVLDDNFKEWNRELKAFCQNSVASMLLMQNYVYAKLTHIKPVDKCSS